MGIKNSTQHLSSLLILVILLLAGFSGTANPVFTSVSANSATVSKYQKFELTVNLTASYSNPYDFNQINLKCKFTSPTGLVYHVDGFYYQAFNMPQPNNLVAVGSPDWRVRFAPNEAGTWSYLLTCTDINGTTAYPVGQMQCTASALRGFIHPAANNQFVYDDGGKFFGIGTNLGWTEWSQGFTIYEDWINELGENGGNFTKIVMAPWSFEPEWQETGTGNYSSRQNRAWALDWIYEHLANNGIYCQLNIMIHDVMKPANTPGWNQNPYNLANGGPCNEPQNFLVNTTAKSLFQRKIRYIMARWGYSPYTAAWEILSEADNTGVYNDFRTQTVNWLNEMSAFTKSADIRNRPISSGFAIPEHDADYWNSASTTFTQMHIYTLIPDLEIKIYNYSKDYLAKYNKPAIVGEFSLAYTPEEVFQNDPTGITFHNTLWASALSGTASTALSWWWNSYLYPNGLFAHFAPLSTFLEQVNFPAQNVVYETPLCTANVNTTLDIFPAFGTTLQKAPENNFIISPNGSIVPNETNLGKFLYGYFFNSYRNPPTFTVNFTKPGEFTVYTGANVSLSKIKIWLDGVNKVNNTASANAYYTISVPAGQHTIFVENTGNGIMEIAKYRLLNYAPVLRSFIARNSDHAIGWMQNRKYNWEYINQNGTPPPVTGGTINLQNFTKGVYKVDWFNTSGNFDSTLTVLNSTGNIAINSPQIIWDGAYELSFLSPLSVAFTATPTSGDAPMSVQFTNASFNGGVTVDSYFWDFGDGITSTQQNPAHVYASPGTYDVFFKIQSGIYADSVLKNDLITVTQPLVAEFNADHTQSLLNYPVHFSDLSLGEPTSWLWNFGDNQTSTYKNPTHHYTQTGFFDVTLTITKGNKSDSEIKYDYIEVYTPLIANFTADITFAFSGNPVQFTDLSQGSPESWKWDFGNGEFSTTQNPSFSYAEPGVYSVELLIKANWRTDSLTKVNFITVADSLIADFTADKTLAFPGETIQLTDLTQGNPTSWYWDFGNGQTSTLQNPEVQFNTTGSYPVKLIVTNTWLADTLVIENYITIVNPLIADFTASKTAAFTGDVIQFTDLSQGNPESWFWDFGNGEISTSQNPSFSYAEPGVYSVELLIKANWRTDSLTKVNFITVADSLIADFTADKTLAFPGETIQLTDLTQGNPTSWYWDFGNGQTSTLQNPEVQFNTTGSYPVKLIVTNTWLADTLVIENYITIVNPLIADFTASKTAAFTGDVIQFTDLSQGNPESWFWDFGNGESSNLQNPVFTFITPGVYTIKLVVSTNWLTDSLAKQNYITVIEKLVANFKADTTFAWLGHTTQFTDLSIGNPTGWWWNFGDQTTSQLQNPTHQYTREETFTVVLAVVNQNQNDYEIKTNYITIREPLKAQFVADTTKVLVGQNVHFTNLSTGFPTSSVWDFGDNTVSPVLNPVHHYLQPGFYMVSLQIFENDSTDVEIKENYIWVRDTLVAGFYAEPLTIHAGETVHFYDTSQGSITQWKWYFGEGKTSNQQNPVYKFNNPGTYNVSLIVFDAFGSDTLYIESYITVLQPIHSQIIFLSQGWSGISTYLLPENPGIADIFQTVEENLIIAVNDTGIYWPSQNINTIGNWNPLDGLIVKMTEETLIEISGDLNPVTQVDLLPGWNILPVIGPCSQTAAYLFGALGDTLVMVKEIAGVKIYWPEPNIHTLEYLDAGESYFILVNHAVSVHFQACGQNASFDLRSNPSETKNPDVVKNGSSISLVRFFRQSFRSDKRLDAH